MCGLLKTRALNEEDEPWNYILSQIQKGSSLWPQTPTLQSGTEFQKQTSASASCSADLHAKKE